LALMGDEVWTGIGGMIVDSDSAFCAGEIKVDFKSGRMVSGVERKKKGIYLVCSTETTTRLGRASASRDVSEQAHVMTARIASSRPQPIPRNRRVGWECCRCSTAWINNASLFGW